MKRREFGQVVVAGGLAALVPVGVRPLYLKASQALEQATQITEQLRIVELLRVFRSQEPNIVELYESNQDALLYFVERHQLDPALGFPFNVLGSILSFSLGKIATCGWEVDPDNGWWDGPTLAEPEVDWEKGQSFMPVLRRVAGCEKI